MRTHGYITCERCKGRKHLGEQCPRCDGTGAVEAAFGSATTWCRVCRGTGHIGPVCPDCQGRGETYTPRLAASESMAGILLERWGPGLYVMPEGWKACAARHREWRVRDVGGAVCCPGCDRLCKTPGAQAGDQVKIMLRG